MCRLLGTVSHESVTLDEVLGDERGPFFGLAAQHGDGWGHAWDAGAGLQVAKAPESALRSPELDALTAGQPARAALTHLRWATLGLSVRHDNTHPFTDGQVAFAHNGSIAPPQALDALVPAGLRDLRRGDTDSERYFLAVLARLAEGADAATALAATVADVLASGARVGSLHALLLTPDELLAVCCYDPGSYADPEYYPLLHRRAGGTVVVASTGWTDPAGWSTLGNGQVLVVDRATLGTRVVPVAVPDPLEAAS